ncbi:MAG TPA: hypothetical protein DCO93_03270 [Clostridiales bacterium]|nr:hypothetical protein [Clostridiales bacterium]
MSWLAVKNETSSPVISVFIDEKRIFSDILKGEMSEYALLECGSAAITVYNNFEKLIFDEWISIPPCTRLVLTASEKFLKFI